MTPEEIAYEKCAAFLDTEAADYKDAALRANNDLQAMRFNARAGAVRIAAALIREQFLGQQ